MSMIVYDEDALDGVSHAIVFIVVLQSLEAGCYRWIFFRLRFFCAERKIGERVARMTMTRLEPEEEDENSKVLVTG